MRNVESNPTMGELWITEEILGELYPFRVFPVETIREITNILLNDIRRIESEVKIIEQPTEHSQSESHRAEEQKKTVGGQSEA